MRAVCSHGSPIRPPKAVRLPQSELVEERAIESYEYAAPMDDDVREALIRRGARRQLVFRRVRAP